MKEGKRKDFNPTEEVIWGVEEAAKKIQGQHKEVKANHANR